jgi:hypothetical protein
METIPSSSDQDPAPRSSRSSDAVLNGCASLDLTRLGEAGGQSEPGFRKMLDSLPAAIYTTDAEGRVTL